MKKFYLMKKKRTFILFYFILIFSSEFTMGQKVLVTPIIGYGFGITGDAWTTDSKVYTLVINGQDTTMPYFDNYTQHLVSFSGKLRMGLGLGYKLNKNITTGLDFYYVGGRKVEFTISDEYINGNNHDYGKCNSTYRTRSFTLVPNLSFSPGFEKVNPFLKIGLVVSSSKIFRKDDVIFKGPDFIYEDIVQQWDYTGKIFYGFQTACGVETNISKRINILVELNYDQISFIPTKAEMNLYTINMHDMLPGSSTSEKEIEFVDSYSNQYPSDRNKPSQAIKEKFNLNSFVIRAGVSFKF